ncbi:MAG: ABC transporter permease [Acidimicrobiia bacterium]|nr:ABC transporter permease [Acidimicrobiia bacterium]
MLEQVVDASLWASVMRALVPVLLAAIGGMICERAGVFQISLEGMILVGAFGAVAAAHVSGSAVVAASVAALAAVALSLILAFGAVSRGGNAIVLGVAINILAAGLTAFLLPQMFGVRGSFQPDGDVRISSLSLGALSEIPFVGRVLFDLSILGYLALLLVPAIWFFLFRTQIGLRLRGVGERPLAASTFGVSPHLYKYGAVIASGVLAGLAGAQLSLGNVGVFTANMSSGRGWIAVVAVLLGRAHPFGVLAACVLFGFTEAFGFRLQGQGLPVQITDALPFVVTLVVLVIARKRFTRLLDLTAGNV